MCGKTAVFNGLKLQKTFILTDTIRLSDLSFENFYKAYYLKKIQL